MSSPGRPIGWRAWLSDGTEVSSKATLWDAIPSGLPQHVIVYYDATYQIVTDDGCNEQGFPINQRVETENYCDQVGITEQVPVVEAFWMESGSRGDRFIKCGRVIDIPPNTRSQWIKLSNAISREQWEAIYVTVQNRRKFDE